jgi:DNA-binding PadR family transcriptional regulator
MFREPPAVEAREAAYAEAKRRERKTIALNKLGEAALKERREWVRDKRLARPRARRSSWPTAWPATRG